jgi:hypothetical protein
MDWLCLASLPVLAVLAAGAIGCSSKIGDKCTLNTDCSISNTRACDTSQPDGYCTIFNCSPNTCPDQAACVEFQASIAGCPYDDYASPARTGRTFCMETCHRDSDCRDGYVCADPTGQPWLARIVDDNHSQSVCILPTDVPSSQDVGAPVCPGAAFDAGAFPEDTGAPAPEASVPGLDGGVEGGGVEGGTDADAGVAGPAEGGADAPLDAPLDSTLDAPADAALDTSADVTGDAPVESGASDAGGDGG